MSGAGDEDEGEGECVALKEMGDNMLGGADDKGYI